MGYNQVSVSRILVSCTLTALGGHHLQIVGVTVSLWLIIQVSQADSSPQVKWARAFQTTLVWKCSLLLSAQNK